jgi:hypothetical protein
MTVRNMDGKNKQAETNTNVRYVHAETSLNTEIESGCEKLIQEAPEVRH